jgi:exonuclease III
MLIIDEKIDIITIQETKLKITSKTPPLNNYTALRTDRLDRAGGGLITYIKNDITFTNINLPNNINTQTTELQIIKIHLSNTKHLHIINLYIPPKDIANPIQATIDTDITNCFNFITNLTNTIITADINAHHPLWFSPTTDNRGTLISDLLINSDHLTLNQDTPTRIPAINQHHLTYQLLLTHFTDL